MVTELREEPGTGRVRLSLGGGGAGRGSLVADIVVAADGALSRVCAGHAAPGDQAAYQVCGACWYSSTCFRSAALY